MSDPRVVSNNAGIGVEAHTYKYDATITYDATVLGGASQAGWGAVTMVGDDTVGLAVDGDRVAGQLIKVEQDACTVYVEGVRPFKAGTGQTLHAGKRIVGALGAASAKGYIRDAAEPGGAYSQATATDVTRGRGNVLNGSDGTAVMVDL